jgi:transposase-like protein
VDKTGQPIDVLCTEQRDERAAKRFLTKAIRQVKSLNNIIEQAHRGVKRLTRPTRAGRPSSMLEVMWGVAGMSAPISQMARGCNFRSPSQKNGRFLSLPISSIDSWRISS